MLDLIHVPFAANIINFVVLTAIISAANSGLYASTRMLWSLGNEGTIPKAFTKTNKRGIPVLSLVVSMLGGIFALISSKVAASTGLSSISFYFWISCCIRLDGDCMVRIEV